MENCWPGRKPRKTHTAAKVWTLWMRRCNQNFFLLFRMYRWAALWDVCTCKSACSRTFEKHIWACVGACVSVMSFPWRRTSASVFFCFFSLGGLKLHLLAARSLLIDRCRNLPVFSAIICTSKAFYTVFEMFFNWRAYCFLCWLLPFLLNWRGWECGEEQRYRNSVTYASNNDWRANDGRRSTNWPTKLVAPLSVCLCCSLVLVRYPCIGGSTAEPDTLTLFLPLSAAAHVQERLFGCSIQIESNSAMSLK